MGDGIADVLHQAFDTMIHFTYEGSWLYLSTFGRTVNGSEGPLADVYVYPVL